MKIFNGRASVKLATEITDCQEAIKSALTVICNATDWRDVDRAAKRINAVTDVMHKLAERVAEL